MAYYFAPGPPAAGMPQPVGDKQGFYTYNGHVATGPMQVPTQRTMTGAPIMHHGPPMPQPGGPPPIGLAGASPLASPSPGASPLQPGPSPLHLGGCQMPPGTSHLQPGSSQLQPGTSALQNGLTTMQPGSSPYPVNSSSPTYVNGLPSGMYATSTGLYQCATLAYPQPGQPPSMAPPGVPTNPYMARSINPYATQGAPIHSVPVVQPPCTQTLLGPGYAGYSQGPIYSSQGYAMPQMGGGMLAYAAPAQQQYMVSPYTQVLPQGVVGAPQPGASYPRPPTMP